MAKISEMNLLLAKRDLLIEKQKSDLESLKFQFHETRKVMSPANIIKSTLVNMNLKESLTNIALGLATNYLINKFPSIFSENNFQKFLKRFFKYNN